jgi:hypothetical protein
MINQSTTSIKATEFKTVGEISSSLCILFDTINSHGRDSATNPVSKSPLSLFLTDESFTSNLQAAILWHEFGFNVIPLIPGSKIPAVTWDSWLNDLSAAKITNNWKLNPKHEVGFIVGDETMVLDADSPESTAALYSIENALGITPNLIVKTAKGEHHHFKRAAGTYAKTDSHDTAQYPNRIDVKTGRSMVILPPSTGKEIEICDAANADDLTEINQDVIDAIFRHNGRPVPRPQGLVTAPSVSPENHKKLALLLDRLDADLGYEDWIHVGMAIYHETGGSDDGLALFNSWSSKGAKYKGVSEIRLKWQSFKFGSAAPITIGTIYKMLSDRGVDWRAVELDTDDEFKICTDVAVIPNPLSKFSLRGQSEQIEANLQDAVLILGKIAVCGQLAVIYAEFGSGKTLTIIHMAIKSIEEGLIDPEKLYYCNMDDSVHGLVEKNRLAEEYGFHMLSQAFNGFDAKVFLTVILELIATNQATGVIVILDTLKKFTDVMSKKDASDFANTMRQFSLKGGTVIALAHTNKHKDSNGKSIYSGTADILADFDVGYTVDVLSDESGIKTIEFTVKKRRGKVADSVAYSYKSDSETSWLECLFSIEEVDSFDLFPLKQAVQKKADAEIADAVKACICEGTNQKMKLVKASAIAAGVSQAIACGIIEKYTGESSYWQFTVGAKGAKVFQLFE